MLLHEKAHSICLDGHCAVGVGTGRWSVDWSSGRGLASSNSNVLGLFRSNSNSLWGARRNGGTDDNLLLVSANGSGNLTVRESNALSSVQGGGNG